MQNKTAPARPGAPTPIKPTKPEPQVTPSPVLRQRTVKRFTAFVPVETAEAAEFNGRAKPTLHPTKDAATVEAIRWMRANMADAFYSEVTAKRTAQVVRTIVSEEIVE